MTRTWLKKPPGKAAAGKIACPTLDRMADRGAAGVAWRAAGVAGAKHQESVDALFDNRNSSETRLLNAHAAVGTSEMPPGAMHASTVRRVAAHGNWQDAVADVPAALDSFTVAETTVEAAT